MKKTAFSFTCLLLTTPAFSQNWGALPYTRHADLQSVTPTGAPAYSSGFPIRLRGVLLNTPGSVFSDAPNFVSVNWPATAFQFGGRQQPYVQAVDSGDSGGTAMFLAQSLGNHPVNQDDAFSYPNAQWLLETARLSADPATGRLFEPGDLVEIRARVGLHFSGKFNVNEAHSNNPANDYDLILLQPAFGLPAVQPIVIADIKNSSNTDIFDPTRATGGERYQSQLVLLRNVTIDPTGNWTPEGALVVRSGGRTLPVLLGTNTGFSTTTVPAGRVDIRGIFDQEATPAPVGGTNGYRLIALSPGAFTPACIGDYDGNSTVSVQDIFDFLSGWFASIPRADVNADDSVTVQDIFDFLTSWFGGCA